MLTNDVINPFTFTMLLEIQSTSLKCCFSFPSHFLGSTKKTDELDPVKVRSEVHKQKHDTTASPELDDWDVVPPILESAKPSNSSLFPLSRSSAPHSRKILLGKKNALAAKKRKYEDDIEEDITRETFEN